mgnify:CR=1 FL=1
MIVVAIIGLLAAIAIPAFMRNRDNARRVACINNLRQLSYSKNLYITESGGTNGSSMTWDNLAPYIEDVTNKMFCPSAPIAMRGMTNYSIEILGVDPVCVVVGPAGGHSRTN